MARKHPEKNPELPGETHGPREPVCLECGKQLVRVASGSKYAVCPDGHGKLVPFENLIFRGENLKCADGKKHD